MAVEELHSEMQARGLPSGAAAKPDVQYAIVRSIALSRLRLTLHLMTMVWEPALGRTRADASPDDAGMGTCFRTYSG